jgi:anti-sigma factor RsiW
MNCSDINELAPLYATGELDNARAAGFAEHLKACAACEREIEQQRRMDARLRQAVLADEFDTAQMESRIRERISASAPVRRPAYAWQLAAAAVLLLAVAAGIGYRVLLSSRVPQVYADAADDHQQEIVAKQPRHWLSDRAAIESLAAKHQVPMAAIDALAAKGYHLERAKVCSLDDRLFLHLVYSSDGQEYSLFLRRADLNAAAGKPKELVNGTPIYESDRGDAHVAGFQSQALTGLVVTDATGDAAVRAAEIAFRGL